MIISGRKSSPDPRDFEYRPRALPPRPAQVHREWMTPLDQGPVGTCEANAGAAYMKWLYPDFVASRLAIHYAGRKMEGTLGKDEGIETRDLMKVLQAGVISENVWSYDLSKIEDDPPRDFPVKMIGTYNRIRGAEDLLDHLAFIGPVILAFNCPTAFSWEVDWPDPNNFESKGWHCVTGVDYPNFDRIRCMNSWGPAWNQRGFFTMPITWAVQSTTGDDIWAATMAPRGTVAGVPIEGEPV